MSHQLEIIDSQGRRWRVPLNRPRLLIGREATCDIHLPHPNVSRRHAQLQQTDQGDWLLQDLSSLNHVYVEEKEAALSSSPRAGHSNTHRTSGPAWRMVEQLVLEPDVQVRIAEFRLVLKEVPGEKGKAEDPTENWTGLEPGWLEQLQAFQRSLLRLDDAQHVLERLAAEFHRVAHARTIAVGVPGPEVYQWPVVVGEGEGPGLFSTLQDAEQHLADDSDVRGWTSPGCEGRAPAPSLLFPIRGRSSTLGHVLVQGPRYHPLSAAVHRYLGLLTTHAGLVWENFQLVALRLAQQEILQELRSARQIQVDLFPPSFDVDPRLNAFGVNLPSVQVSGDYYDLFMTGPDTAAFVIADAMGHGLPAALMMAAVRASLRMGVTHGLSWEAVFQGLDGIITQVRFGGGFVTGLLGEVDLARRELRVVSAGHNPASIIVDGRPVAFPEQCQTRPWGLNFEYPWTTGVVPLGRDWSILCYTDGIIEGAARVKAGSGCQFVADFHQRHHADNAEDLCQGLLSEVSADSGGPLGDDQTVLALRSAS